MIARFRVDGVDLSLDKSEYVFLYLALGHVLYGQDSLDDTDFRNVLGATRTEAERLLDSLATAEDAARRAGSHWNPGSSRSR